MIDIILDAIKDSCKLLPFLFITFLLMEYLEHKMTHKSKKIIQKSGKFGPFFGSLLGIFPQCGFSVAATNLYSARVITLGTLIAVFLATSDEMLPILISENVSISFILLVLFIKFIVGVFFGFLIDFILKKNKFSSSDIHQLCEKEHCNCEHGILKSTIKHTINIFIFILISTLFINLCFNYLGEELLTKILMKNSLFGPILSSLIGLIPNCGASVLITQLYLSGAISFASLISGLLTGSGVGLLVLFKSNKDIKENMKVLLILYLIGVFVGMIIQLITIFM